MSVPATPTNILQNVITYNKINIAMLLNQCCMLNIANKEFNDFEKSNPANLGDTISFEKQYRFTSKNSLVVSFQGTQQRPQTLKVDRAISIGLEYTAEQLIFNIDRYKTTIANNAAAEIGSKVEYDLTGVFEEFPYRFYGDGINPINSFGELGKAFALFDDFGSASYERKAVLPTTVVPSIVNTGLNQFVPSRNEELAMSWRLGDWNNATWYQSNLLRTHYSGTVGDARATLTVVSTVQDPLTGAVIAITFSGCPSPNDPVAIKKYDRFLFDDTSTSQLRFLTFTGHVPCSNPVQFKSVADAASDAGSQVTVFLDVPLQAASGRDQNITASIVPGMTVTVLPSHKVGGIFSGNQFYAAMPRLPSMAPYYTGTETDPSSGVGLRMYTGGIFGQNQYGTVIDGIWGRTMVPENAMALIFPL